jgi:alkaline phosphatase D
MQPGASLGAPGFATSPFGVLDVFSRRLFLAATGAALWVPASARGQSGNKHFTLGVASGSPRETSIVLWTRLAPNPLQGGGMPAGLASVRWRLCADAAMRRTLRQGVVETSEAKAHAVHVTVQGLEPGREYFYQFAYGDEESAVGRTKTADPRAKTAKLALANCQAWETGQYAAYRDMAEWTPDCVIHVGDYIYEGATQQLGERRRTVAGEEVRFEIVRQHDGPETVTLYDYRNRYALYRSDPHLQAAHGAAPWIVAMDDHEVDNNWAGGVPQDPEKQSPLEFAVRKLAAFQAFYEHMPIEQPPILNGLEGRLQMHGAYRFGPAHVNLLDTRQFRTDQVCGQGFPGDFPCADLNDPRQSMTGAAQEAWLLEQLKNSNARYNVIASQTWFAPFEYVDDPNARKWNMDQWDGYPLQRQRLIDAMDGVSHPVVLSGDWHCAMASTIHKAPGDAKSSRVGHNFAATSISSICSWWPEIHRSKEANAHVAHVDGKQRGYLRCEADARNFAALFRTVANPVDANSAVATNQDIRIADI